MQTIIYILPELFLSLTIMFLLMLGIFIKKSFKLVYLLTILSLVFAIVLVLNQPNEIIKIFNESYIIDQLSIFMKILTLLFCFFILLSSKDYIKNNNIDKIECVVTGEIKYRFFPTPRLKVNNITASSTNILQIQIWMEYGIVGIGKQRLSQKK